jgi:hypothetical protein
MAMAENLGASGMPFAIIVMVGASCSFISPMGYQTNLMVYGPGRYESGKPANLLNGETAMKSSTTVEEKALKKSMIGASHLQLLGL